MKLFGPVIAALLTAAPAIGQAQQQENPFPLKVQRDSYPRPEFKYPNAKIEMSTQNAHGAAHRLHRIRQLV